MGAWIGNGTSAIGTAKELGSYLALLKRPSTLAFVDYHYLRNQVRRDLDEDGRLLSFTDRAGNAFGTVQANNNATQFTTWTNSRYGISVATNDGAFQSGTAIIPASGNFSMMALFTHATGSAGYIMANSDTSNRLAMGFHSDDKMRILWGATTIAITGVTNDGNPCMMAISLHTGDGRLRAWHNGVEVYDAAQTIPAQTDRKLMFGGLKAASSATNAITGTKSFGYLSNEAGDDGSAYITLLKEAAEEAADRGWPTT